MPRRSKANSVAGLIPHQDDRNNEGNLFFRIARPVRMDQRLSEIERRFLRQPINGDMLAPADGDMLAPARRANRPVSQ